MGALGSPRAGAGRRRCVAADLVVTAVALLGPWRRAPARARRSPSSPSPWAPCSADVLTGSTLELNGLLGYDAIVAGRFTGYGNLTFGLHVGQRAAASPPRGHRGRPARRARPGRRLATGGTVLVAGARSPSASSARRGWAATSAACWPRCPGFLVLAMLLARVRVTVVRLARGPRRRRRRRRAPSPSSTGCARRPTAATSGRFVEQVLTGEAWTVISRKGAGQPRHPAGQPAGLDAAGRARGRRLAGAARRAAAQPGRAAGGRRPPGCRPRRCSSSASVLLSALLSLTLGAAVNDSGVALPATAAALLVPLLVWLAAGAGRGGTGSGETAGGAPHSGPVEGPERVTVVSRGSTVWNT